MGKPFMQTAGHLSTQGCLSTKCAPMTFGTAYSIRRTFKKLPEERQKALSGTAPFENEQRALGKDGKYRWFLIRYNPLLDESGKVVRWYATGTDIEDRKRTEALRAAETRALEMIADGASLKDVLDHLCSSIDAQVSPSVTTVLLMDPDG